MRSIERRYDLMLTTETDSLQRVVKGIRFAARISGLPNYLPAPRSPSRALRRGRGFPLELPVWGPGAAEKGLVQEKSTELAHKLLKYRWMGGWTVIAKNQTIYILFQSEDDYCWWKLAYTPLGIEGL